MSNRRIPFSAGRYYHVYNHGNANDTIFKKEENFHYFLQKYAEYLFPILETYAYCLMPNHFHFLIRMREEKVIKEFFTKKLNGSHLFFGE